MREQLILAECYFKLRYVVLDAGSFIFYFKTMLSILSMGT